VLLNLGFCCLLFFVSTPEAVGSVEEGNVSSERSVKLSGYTQATYSHWEEGKEGFRIKQARVSLKGNIFKNIDFKLQVDAVRTPILLDAAIGVNLSSYAKFTFGQFKVPFSIENLISGADLDTITRSYTVSLLCPGRPTGAVGRDIGIAVNGKVSRFEYTLGVFNGSGINQSDLNEQKDLAGRLVFSPFNTLAIGLSHYDGKYSPHLGDPIIETARTGADLFFVHEGFSLKGEYIFARENQTERYGFYVQSGYFIMKEKLELLAKYDFVDTNLSEQNDRIAVVLLGLNYFFSKRTKIQFNYAYHTERLGNTSRNVILAQIQVGF